MVETDTGQRSSVQISYSYPGTVISDGPNARTNQNSPVFGFRSTEPGSTFGCSLDGEDLGTCQPPFAVQVAEEGLHQFTVRSIDRFGNLDPTPAVWDFTLDSTPPDAMITAGPESRTTHRRPTFNYRSSENGSSFICSYDSAPYQPCRSSSMDRPLSDLADGPHRFAVRAVDPAGNAGAEAVSEFEVYSVPVDPVIPPFTLGPLTLDRSRGLAILPVRVPAAGRIGLLPGGPVRPASKRVKGPGVVKLKVVPLRGKKAQLRRKGRLRTKVRVRFTPDAGRPVVRARNLTLRFRKR